MNSIRKNLLLLAASHFCGITVLFANTIISNVIGKEIVQSAEFENIFSPFPYGFMTVASALIIPPAGYLMNKYGTKNVFVSGTVIGFIGSLICIGSLFCRNVHALILFILGLTFQGCAYGVVNYYRHVAANMGVMEEGIKSWYVAIVISSGAVAGIVGPGIISASKPIFHDHAFLASNVCVAVIYIIHCILIYFTTFLVNLVKIPIVTPVVEPRSLLVIIKNPNYLYAFFNGVISHSLMILFMGITPHMLNELSVFYISLTIQLHAVCMFLPSFLTSKLISKFGSHILASVGYGLGIIGASLYLVRDGDVWHEFAAVIVALAIIGFGWNCTFVSSTTLLTASYKPNEKYKAQAFNDTWLFGVGGIFLLVSGILFKYGGWKLIIGICIGMYGIVAVLNLFVVCKRKRLYKIIEARTVFSINKLNGSVANVECISYQRSDVEKQLH